MESCRSRLLPRLPVFYPNSLQRVTFVFVPGVRSCWLVSFRPPCFVGTKIITIQYKGEWRGIQWQLNLICQLAYTHYRFLHNCSLMCCITFYRYFTPSTILTLNRKHILELHAKSFVIFLSFGSGFSDLGLSVLIFITYTQNCNVCVLLKMTLMVSVHMKVAKAAS